MADEGYDLPLDLTCSRCGADTQGQHHRCPDRARGEYLDGIQVKVCKACATPPQARRHTCGLADLQDMLRF